MEITGLGKFIIIFLICVQSSKNASEKEKTQEHAIVHGTDTSLDKVSDLYNDIIRI